MQRHCESSIIDTPPPIPGPDSTQPPPLPPQPAAPLPYPPSPLPLQSVHSPGDSHGIENAYTAAADKLNLLKWFYIAAGIWCLVASLAVALVLCCWLTWVLQFMAGLAFIVYGANTVARPGARPNPAMPWLLVACIINCDIVAAIFGIAILVIQAAPEVKFYYERLAQQPYFVR